MLILTRKDSRESKDQSCIVIGEGEHQVIVNVVAIDGCRVKIGIEAGKEIKILRGELREKNGK